VANTLLGTVTILIAHNSHTVGDVITIFYDPDTALFSVYEDPQGASPNALVTSLGGLKSNRTENNYSRVDTGFEFQSDTNIMTYFVGFSAYPFYAAKTREIIETGIDDLILGVDSITKASAAGVADGAVTLRATGTHTPIQYSLNDGPYQLSATFSGLYSSNYTISAKDSLNYKRTIDVSIEANEVPIEGVTHGLKYTMSFIEGHRSGVSRDGVLHKVNIYKRGYTDATVEVLGGQSPVIINARAEGSLIAVDTNIISHELSISLVSETLSQFREMALGDEYEFLVLYSIDDAVAKDGSDYNVRFRGYVTPETYVEDYGDIPYVATFSATDRLADLTSIKFFESRVVDAFGIEKIQPINGVLREAYIIDKCLENIKMNQGYRIAIDMFEENMNATNTDTPLHQAYEDCKSYYDKDVDSCLDVITKILRPYGAVLLSYNDFFYIIKEEQLKQTTVNYVEFTTIDGTGSAGSFSPRISFKSNGSSNMFRYTGPQTLEFTRGIKYINVIANGIKKEAGILKAWDEDSILYDGETFLGYQDFNLVLSQEIYSKEYINGNDYGWALDFYADTGFQNSSSYIRSSKNISYTSADSLKIEFEVRVDTYKEIRSNLIAPPVPYIPLKWKFKLGSDYLQSNGEWTTDDVVNQFFFDDINSGGFKKFTIDVKMPNTATQLTSADYDFRIYPATVWEYDISAANQAAAVTAIEAVTTVNLPPGSRRVVRFIDGGDYAYFYYELNTGQRDYTDASKANMTEIRPSDYASGSPIGRRWISLGSWSDSATPSFSTYRSKNIIKDVVLKTLPNGQEAPDQFGETNVISENNTIDLTIDLFHFDLSNQVNNDENIYSNYTRLSDDSPTGLWDRLGGTQLKTRQSHLKDRVFELYKTPRYKMSVGFYSDLEISILTHLYDADDDGRIFILKGVEINPKQGIHSGEIEEIFNSGTPVVGSFNNDFDTDNEFA
jgi:hypothetical protein